MSLLIVFFAVLTALIFIKHHLESRSFPPGYPRLPLIGSLLSYIHAMGSAAVIKSSKNAYRYNDGKFMGIFIGPVARGVFVFDFNIAKEFVFNDIYLGKYGSDYARNMRGYNGTRVGIIQTEGHTWKTNRRFSLSTLRGELGYISISVHGK